WAYVCGCLLIQARLSLGTESGITIHQAIAGVSVDAPGERQRFTRRRVGGVPGGEIDGGEVVRQLAIPAVDIERRPGVDGVARVEDLALPLPCGGDQVRGRGGR